ncbi:hypothetical protein ES702_06611 [subsurface metagenome]
MEDLFYIFDPGTNTSKCPIPTRFDHLLKFVTRVEQYIALHSQEDIININSQLDKTTNLIISNIIQRVIAQIIGQTDKGFVTIKGTDDGAIHVSVQEDPDSLKTPLKAKIAIATAVTHDIIGIVAGKSHHITSIMFTVAGEVNITLRDETGTFTGAMDFGGTNEPRGMTHNHETFPLICTAGEKFQITLSAAIQVSGYVTYYDA